MLIIEFETLKKIFGGATAAEVAVRLKKAGVKYIQSKKGQPVTTLDALNYAMGIKTNELYSRENKVQLNDVEIL